MKDANYFFLLFLTIFTLLGADEKKKVLVEYVGSTMCPYCPQVTVLLDQYQDSSHEDYFGKEIVDNMVVIRYHTYNPSYGDPMYAAIGSNISCTMDFTCVRTNGEESVEWYAVTGVPSVFIDGKKTSNYLDEVKTTQTERTPVKISLNGSSFDDLTVNAKITITSETDLSAEPLYLFVMATIDSVHYVGYNGETEHEQVFLGFIGDTGPGLGKPITLNKDQGIEWTDTWKMPIDYPNPANGRDLGSITDWNTTVWDKKNMNLVAFVQNKTTLEVIQVEMISRRNMPATDLNTESIENPNSFVLHPNYPNPFNPQTQIRFEMPYAENIDLSIYNLLGVKIRTLYSGKKASGVFTFKWDGKNDKNQLVSGGVYIYKLQSQKAMQMRKMILLK